MRYLIVSLICATLSFPMAAQETAIDVLPLELARSREIGIMTQTTISGDSWPIDLHGIQFKKWLTQHLGWRAIAAYGRYSVVGNPWITSSAPDTVVRKHLRTNINLAVIGGGIEAQRRFYKRVYLFAAVELKGGYGSGTTDTLIVQDYFNNPESGGFVSGTSDVKNSMVYVGLTPSVGAKLLFKRITFGAEIIPADMRYTSIGYENSSTQSNLDFNLGFFTHRLFFHYRF